MNHINKKNLNLFLVVSVLIISLSAFVSADFALGFISGIIISPGESVDDFFSLQNVIEPTTDIVVEVIVEEGAEYITFNQTTFNIAAGEIISIPITFSVSSSASVGDVYPAKVWFRTVSGGGGEGGTVEFTTGIRKSFNIIITEPTARPAASETTNNITLWIIGIAVIILLIAIIWIIVNKKKNNPNSP